MSPHHSGSATALHSNPLAAQPAASRPGPTSRRSSAAPTSNRHRPAAASSSPPVHAAIGQPVQHLSYFQQHTAELAAYITQIFLPSVLPTAEEYQIKEQTRQYLETLADKVSPGARLLPFGSIASGLALRNSDMDLCCLIDKPSTSSSSPASSTAAPSTPPKHTPAEMVMILGKLIQEVKVWTKRRRINDPYLGTLSSYGYVLLVIYYLVNNRKSAVLPNLQQLPPPRPTPPEDLYLHGHSIYFFDDLDALPRYWSSNNRENVGELLIDFFRFFASSFRYTHDVISVRSIGGLVSKESKGWMHDIIEDGNGKPENAGGGTRGPYGKVDLNRLCIEDPFQTNYNVARTVTRDGLFTIRGEFMRAVRVLSTRTDRLDVMIRELCEERQEGVLMAPPSSSGRRKSAPNPKPTLVVAPLELASPLTTSQAQPTRGCWTASSSTSSSARPANEESQDEEFQQILIQQQQETLRQRLQLQDYVYRQATSSTDARPRYPPESIASEPAPELDWNQSCHQHYHHQQHDSSIGYQLENEIQALQIRASTSRNDDPPPVISNNNGNSINDTNSAAGGGGSGANYFHRFFRAGGGCANANPSASTSKTETIYESSSSNNNNPNPSPNPTNTSTNGYHHNHHHHLQHQQQLYQHQLLLHQQQQPTFLDFSCLPIPGPIRFGNFSGGISATTTGGGGENGENGGMTRKTKAASSHDLPSRIIFGDVEVMTPTSPAPPPPQPSTTTSSSSIKNGTTTSTGRHHNKKERVASSESSSSNNHHSHHYDHSHTNNNRDRDKDKDKDSNRVVSRSAEEV